MSYIKEVKIAETQAFAYGLKLREYLDFESCGEVLAFVFPDSSPADLTDQFRKDFQDSSMSDDIAYTAQGLQEIAEEALVAFIGNKASATKLAAKTALSHRMPITK